MSVALDPEQLRYFQNKGLIEFEALLSPNQIQTLKQVFSNHLKGEKLPLKQGFDLWRKEPELKKIVTQKIWAQLAGQLIQKNKIRLGATQALTSKCYEDHLAFQNRKSCIRDFLCGLCLCIEPTDEPENPYFPTTSGNGIFFRFDEDFYLRFPKTKGAYLFIFYSTYKAAFSHQSDDPLNLAFRSLGYENGDYLKEEKNPSFTWMNL